MRRLAILLLLALPLVAPAQTRDLVWHIAGSEVGKTTATTNADGTFRSETHLEIGPTKIASVLSGAFKDGKIVAFRLEQSASNQSVVIEGKDGQATVTAGDQTKTSPFTPHGQVFSNYHPTLLSTVVKSFDPSGNATQPIRTAVIEGMTLISLDTTKQGSKVIQLGGKSEVVASFKVALPGVAVDVFLNPGGDVVAWSVPTQRLEVVANGYEALFVDPTTMMPELSQPSGTTKVERGVMVPMRDGIEMAADIVRPTAEGKYPAILIRTPYGRGASAIEGDWWAKRGYVLIAQDVRGRGDSKGAWNPFMPERQDGFDTIEWVAKQPWCNGKVGMIGGSYLGMVQWQAAVERPPALKAIVPQVSPPDMFFNIPYDNGIPFLLGAVWWARAVQDEAGLGGAFAPITSLRGLLTLPISQADEAVLGYNVPFVDDWWTRTTNKAFAPANFQVDMKNVEIPALMISGWWDGDGIGTKLNWERMRELRKPNQYLIYGPWTHLFNTSSSMGDVDYGSQAILELQSVYLRWFDHWLKDKPVLADMPKVKVFVTGANEWRTYGDWPPATAPEKTLYFAKGQKLSEKKQGMDPPTTFVYDPASVELPETLELSTAGGSTIIPSSDLNDHALFATDPLAEAMVAGGPLAVDLYFKTDVVDTDFFVFLVDIDEKGVRRLIGMPGKMRARYRHGMDRQDLLEPGRAYSLRLDLWDTAHEFKKGHRVGVLITSMMFPNYARNLNTGEPDATGTRMVTAHQSIFHDVARPSALRFRLLEKD